MNSIPVGSAGVNWIFTDKTYNRVVNLPPGATIEYVTYDKSPPEIVLDTDEERIVLFAAESFKQPHLNEALKLFQNMLNNLGVVDLFAEPEAKRSAETMEVPIETVLLIQAQIKKILAKAAPIFALLDVPAKKGRPDTILVDTGDLWALRKTMEKGIQQPAKGKSDSPVRGVGLRGSGGGSDDG